MSETAFLLAPAYILFFLGMLLRRTGILDNVGARLLFRLVYSVSMPVMVLLVFPCISLSSEIAKASLLALPAVAAVSAAAAAAAGSMFRLPEEKRLALFRGTLSTNTGLLIPFIQALYGDEELAILFLFWGAGAIAASLFLHLPVSFGQLSGTEGKAVRAFLAPALIALLCGLAMNLLGLRFDPVAAATMHEIGKLTVPLLLFASGASTILPKTGKAGLFAGSIACMTAGAAVALPLALFMELGETTRMVAVLCAAAPAGLLYQGALRLENRDGEFPEIFASSGMLAFLILVPVLLFIL